ncbi:MAG TPA: guanylate kinase [Chloroflexia bacterium]|nr:guanylate kinase [Chloroflexia bacterium]
MDKTNPHSIASNFQPEKDDAQVANRDEKAKDLPPDIARIALDEGDAPEFDLYINRPKPPLLVVLTGPSGVGKDAALQAMAAKGIPFHYVVTVTTRGIRSGEIEGVHYFFKTREEYEEMLIKNQLLEHSPVYGNYYGVPRSEVVDYLRRGEDVIMKPDVLGARKMRALEPDAVYIFLAPPSMQALASRLYHRKTEDPQELANRLKLARAEMQDVSDFDYVVVNKSQALDETVAQIEAIILAEKCRVHPRKIRLAGNETDE